MPRNIETVFKAELDKAVVKLAYLVTLEFDEGTIAFSSTCANINYSGITYIGFGNLGKVSSLSEGLSLDPQTHNISLSGVNQDILNLLLTTNYINRPSTCYLAALNDQNEIIGTPLTYFKGTMDSLAFSFGKIANISVIIKDELAIWDRPKKERYTHQDQQTTYPTDLGFEFVAELSSKTVIWPNRVWFKNNV
jgi:hypothetical protein